MTAEYSTLVNQKLLFARLTIDELDSVFSTVKLAGAITHQNSPIVENKRLIQSKFESILHHMSAALLAYLFEIDAFSENIPVGQFVADGETSITSLSQFKSLLSKNSHNPNLEELKLLYQNPRSAIRQICEFNDSVSQTIQHYRLPSIDAPNSSPNIIAVDGSNNLNDIVISIETLAEMMGEFEELFTRQRAMSIED